MEPPSAQSPFAQCRYSPTGETCTPSPARTLLLGHRSYGLIRQSRLALLSFGLSLVQEVSAGCFQPLLPPGSSRRYLCESFLGCLVPYHGGPTGCVYLFLPPCHRPSPREVWVGFPLLSANTTSRGGVFEAADISLCSGLRVCSSPRSFLPLLKVPHGSRDFYIRAERASLPLHAPDMLAVRIQAIDGTRTSTLSDSQPCRPLPSPPPHTARPGSRELPVDPYRDHRWGFPCCVWSPCVHAVATTPAGSMEHVRSYFSIAIRLPFTRDRSAPALPVSGPAQRSLRYGLHARRVAIATRPSTSKASAALLPPLLLRLLPGGANQFPGGTCTR